MRRSRVVPGFPRVLRLLGMLALLGLVSIPSFSAAAVATVERRIAAGTDDAEESASGSTNLASGDLELVYDGSNQKVGMRYTNVTIPPGATITHAYIQFEADEVQSEATNLLIQGEAADNPVTYSSTSRISTRPRTVAGVNWAPAAWALEGEAGAAQRTPELSAVIQELVNRPGWASGNALALVVTGTGHRTARSYEGRTAGAALLHVEYLGTWADEIHWTIIGATAVTCDWRGSETTIRYGVTTSYGQTADGSTPSPMPFSSPGPFHEARLTGLQANTLYHYSIGTGPDHTFRTPPPRGTSGFTVAAEGDIGDAVSYSPMAGVQSLIAGVNPAFVLAMGDLTYGNPNGQTAVDEHFNDVMVWSLDAAYMPVWGNHEWDDVFDDLRNYKGRFDLPNPQSSPGSPAVSCCGEDWSWFDYGNVRLIAYPEPYTGATWTDWNAQAVALMDQVQADPAIKFIVTFGHRPAYSSGHHEGDPELKGYLDALGESHGKYVLNLNGHSHNYERTSPQHGVVHLTAGTGGGQLENDTTCVWRECTPPTWSVFRAMRHGALVLRFTDTSILGQFLCGPSGGVTDDINCTPGSVVDAFTVEASSRTAVERRIAAGTDDAEESASGSTNLASGDLELVYDGSNQKVGMRYTNVTIPPRATITHAYIQFEADEVQSEATNLLIQGEAADNPVTYSSTSRISTRPRTVAGVNWAPAAWALEGEAGAAQRTPELSAVIQELVNRPGWASGNALALVVTGTGHRTARSYEGRTAGAALLHVDYTSGGPPSNHAPLVDAGPDLTITLPADAALDGTVSDDGLPSPPAALTTAWSVARGPGPVTFQNASVVDTRATFTTAGTYVLWLTASDGVLSAIDSVHVTVQPAQSSGGATAERRIATGTDDAEESASGNMYLDSSDLELVYDGSNQKVGMRYTNVTIPPGATITHAYIQFEADEVQSEVTNLLIQGEAADNPVTYSSTSRISTRPRTVAGVSWAPAAWTLTGEAGAAQRTPELSAVIQELVNRPGWASGNALALVVTGTGHRTARSYEGRTAGAALLHVEYASGGPQAAFNARPESGEPPRLELALHGVNPNPSRSYLNVDFSLVDGQPAALDVLDVTGRRVMTREVGPMGPGRHQLDLRGDLRPGLYLVRLAQGSRMRVMKAVVTL